MRIQIYVKCTCGLIDFDVVLMYLYTCLLYSVCFLFDFIRVCLRDTLPFLDSPCWRPSAEALLQADRCQRQVWHHDWQVSQRLQCGCGLVHSDLYWGNIRITRP